MAPPVSPAPLPRAPLAELGDAVPITFGAAGHDGRWLVYCAARADTDGDGKLAVTSGEAGALSGDALEPELSLGGRVPEPIDDFLGADATGRWVVVRKARTVWLVDVLTDVRTDLSALGFDDRDDRTASREHRALAFDPRGELFAYVRAGARRELRLRTLATGAERSVGDLPGEPWRFRWDAGGELLVVRSMTFDSTNDGRVTFPVSLAKTRRFVCQGPVPRFAVAPETGDRESTFLVRRDGGPTRAADDLATPFGASFVARGAGGELLLDQGVSPRRALTTSKCAARVLYTDPARGLLLVACTGGKQPWRSAVELVGPGYRQELGVAVQPTALDRWPDAPARLVPLYPGAESLLVDLQTKRTAPLAPGDRVLATSGTRALVRRGQGLVVVDVEAGAREVTLPGSVERFAPLVTQGSLVAVGRRIFDVAFGTELGSVAGHPLALTPAGEVLVAEGNRPTSSELLRGPLRWQMPARPRAVSRK